MQKLECEPEMEQQNQCRAYDALRTQPLDWDELRFRAWAQGKTGFPMVDACMRCLLSSGIHPELPLHKTVTRHRSTFPRSALRLCS